MRRTRIYRRRRVVRRRPRRRRRRTVRRRGQRENKIQIFRGMLPSTAYIKHRYTRQIRLEEAFQLPECTSSQGLQGVPCVLIASCNNPMAPLNQDTPPGIPPQSPAFLQSGGLSAGVWDRNRYPMLWQFLQRQYSQWTVVGSKIRVSYRPDATPAFINRAQDPAPPLLEFTLLQKASRYVVGAVTPVTTAPFPTNNFYPSIVKEQPGAYTKSWSCNNLYSKDGIMMSRNFSTRKAFGKSKGNVVGESNLQGLASAASSTQIQTGGSYPEEQYYWHMYINPSVASTGVTSSIPPGMFTIEIDYGTVWTERADLPDQ